MRKNLPVTNRERPVQPGQRLITTTTLKGVITYANDDFVEISGFTAEELVGQAHNIIRHPDVPPAVFAHMWSQLKAGRSWMGIVKNRSKNGDFYWVNAFVTPVMEDNSIVGYESVRVMASPREIERATALYNRLNSNRKAVPANWRGVIRSLVPGMFCACVAAVTAYGLGLPGIFLGIALGAPVGFTLQRRREQRMGRVLDAKGDAINDPLLAQMFVDEGGAYGQLQMTLLSYEARLRTFLSRVEDYTRQLEVQAKQGAELSEASLAQLERQRAETDQIAAAINEMTAASQEVASNVARTAEASRIANEQAEKGMGVVSHVRESMDMLFASIDAATTVIHDLAAGARDIGSVVDVIHKIADQTNLLALNAAIEAARAGESGRGFAVVADEVRSLAKGTAESTEEIHKLVSTLQDAAERAVSTMSVGSEQAGRSQEYVVEAENALTQIRSAIHQVGMMSEQIASAAEEQSAVAEEINRSITSVAILSDHTAEEARNQTELSVGLAATAKSQTDLISRFTQRGQAPQ